MNLNLDQKLCISLQAAKYNESAEVDAESCQSLPDASQPLFVGVYFSTLNPVPGSTG